MVILRCKQFSDWLKENGSKLRYGILLSHVTCVWNWHENSIFQTIQLCHIIYLCMLLITTFVSTFILLLLTKSPTPVNAISPEIQHLQLLLCLARSTQVSWTYFPTDMRVFIKPLGTWRGFAKSYTKDVSWSSLWRGLHKAPVNFIHPYSHFSYRHIGSFVKSLGASYIHVHLGLFPPNVWGCFTKPPYRGGSMKPLGVLRGYKKPLYRGGFAKLLGAYTCMDMSGCFPADFRVASQSLF